MLSCAVKFCGGCNPFYDRGKAYKEIQKALIEHVAFETVGVEVDPDRIYDVLLIIKGCSQCQYLYEDISAKKRVICQSKEDIHSVIRQIAAIS